MTNSVPVIADARSETRNVRAVPMASQKMQTQQLRELERDGIVHAMCFALDALLEGGAATLHPQLTVG